MEGLVEVQRAGRVDGHERHVRLVPIRHDDVTRRALGLGENR
jgi:hypothetical protein